jgi:hypothetical protein
MFTDVMLEVMNAELIEKKYPLMKKFFFQSIISLFYGAASFDRKLFGRQTFGHQTFGHQTFG